MNQISIHNININHFIIEKKIISKMEKVTKKKEKKEEKKK